MLTQAAQHHILDPKKTLENLGEQAGLVASLCSKVEDQFESLSELLIAQFSSLSFKAQRAKF